MAPVPKMDFKHVMRRVNDRIRAKMYPSETDMDFLNNGHPEDYQDVLQRFQDATAVSEAPETGKKRKADGDPETDDEEDLESAMVEEDPNVVTSVANQELVAKYGIIRDDPERPENVPTLDDNEIPIGLVRGDPHPKRLVTAVLKRDGFLALTIQNMTGNFERMRPTDRHFWNWEEDAKFTCYNDLILQVVIPNQSVKAEVVVAEKKGVFHQMRQYVLRMTSEPWLWSDEADIQRNPKMMITVRDMDDLRFTLNGTNLTTAEYISRVNDAITQSRRLGQRFRDHASEWQMKNKSGKEVMEQLPKIMESLWGETMSFLIHLLRGRNHGLQSFINELNMPESVLEEYGCSVSGRDVKVTGESRPYVEEVDSLSAPEQQSEQPNDWPANPSTESDPTVDDTEAATSSAFVPKIEPID